MADYHYLVLMSVTPSLAGSNIGALHLPIVWDSATETGIDLANTPVFPNAAGFLDADGYAKARLYFPSNSPSGFDLFFAPYVYWGADKYSSGKPHRVTVY